MHYSFTWLHQMKKLCVGHLSLHVINSAVRSAAFMQEAISLGKSLMEKRGVCSLSNYSTIPSMWDHRILASGKNGVPGTILEVDSALSLFSPDCLRHKLSSASSPGNKDPSLQVPLLGSQFRDRNFLSTNRRKRRSRNSDRAPSTFFS